MLAAAALLGVCVPVRVPVVLGRCGVAFPPSSEDGSGVPGRLAVWEVKFGRRRDVREGEGGSGVGGRL